jgi:hemerythrin-like domain-containing protein
MTNVFDLLKKDHKKVAGIFKDIENVKEGKTQEKKSLFQQLNTELSAHAEFEEMNLYPIIKEDKPTHDLTLESYEEHRLIKQLLNELSGMPVDKDEWDAKLKVLKEQVEHHVEEEEGELFPKAKKVLGKEEIDALTAKKEAQKVKVLVK